MANLEDDERLENEKEASKKSSSGSKTMIYIVIALGVGFISALLIALICALTIISKQEDVTVNEIVPDFIQASKGRQKKVRIEGNNDQDELDENEISYGAFFPMDNFVVNLVDGGFLKIQIFVEISKKLGILVKSRDIPANFLAKIVPAKDSIIDILSGRKASELKTVDGKDILKSDIKDLLNTLLGKERKLVRDVYFTTYLIKD